MKQFYVWRPEAGGKREHARGFKAFDAEDAACRWAEWYDTDGAEYRIVSGQEMAVMVAEEQEEPIAFRVCGESMPSYRAHVDLAALATPTPAGDAR